MSGRELAAGIRRQKALEAIADKKGCTSMKNCDVTPNARGFSTKGAWP
jgi:hypothetical protein